MSEDRRARRRNETVQEILDVALEVMAEEGAAGLSLSEVARRMGLRPPSLYQYFPSKMAIYDALFERGMRQVLELVEQHWAGQNGADRHPDPLRALGAGQQALLGWVAGNRVLAQLIYWRPVPGFTPSLDAFAPSARQLELLGTVLRAAVDAGQLAPDGASFEGIRLYTLLLTGVISQQLANEPAEEASLGHLNGTVLKMFAAHY